MLPEEQNEDGKQKVQPAYGCKGQAVKYEKPWPKKKCEYYYT